MTGHGQCSVAPPLGGRVVQCVGPWGAGVQGEPRSVAGIAADKMSEPPPRAQPRPCPRGTPLEVLRPPQQSPEGPGADSAGAGEGTSPPPAGTGAPHAHITGHWYTRTPPPPPVEGLGHPVSPSRRQCWGSRPRESRPRPVSSQGLRPPHTLSGSPTPPLEPRSRAK